MFIIGNTGDDVNEYTLSTAFDVSTASHEQVFSVVDKEQLPMDLVFNNDHSKMYIIGLYHVPLGTYGGGISEYNLTSPSNQTFCINSAITNLTFNTTGATGIGTATNLPTGVTAAWSSNVLTISGTPTVAGTFAYSVPLTGGCGSVAATGTITVLPTESPAFTYGSATYCETDSDPTPTVTGTSGGIFSATPSGLSINASTGAIDLDASTMGTYAVKYVTSSSVCADSTTFNVTLTATNTVSVNGAYDISTATYVQNFSVQSQEIAPQVITFNNDGTKMFIVGSTGDEVNEYSLSTAFDVSTASYVQNFSVASQDGQPSGLAFNNDGTKMFVVGNTGDAVYEYNLTTAFDVSTASYVQNLSVSSQDTGPGGIAFNNDATKMFIIGHSSDNVFEYSLDNPAVQTVCINDAITNITLNTTGATGIGTPTNLPAGVTASWASDVITITGTPTAAGTFNYTIPLTGGCGTVAATGTITVNDVNTAAAPSTDPTLCVNNALTDITIATTGATGIGTATDLSLIHI